MARYEHGWLVVNNTGAGGGNWRGLEWNPAKGEPMVLVEYDGDVYPKNGHVEMVVKRRREFIAQLGDAGWEIVGVNGLTLYFKRTIE